MIRATEDRVTSLKRSNNAIGLFLQKYSTLFVLFAVIAIFAIVSDRFLIQSNVFNILQQISMLTIVAVGLTFCFSVREIDLSVGVLVGMAGMICPLLIVAGWSVPTAIIATILAGLLVGAMNAVVVVGIGVPSLIATLASGSILGGITYIMSGGRAVYSGLPDTYLFLGQGRVLGSFPVPAAIMIVIVFISWFMLERTVLGRYLYAVGGNARAAELSGINTRLFRTIGLVLTAVFAAVAGILLTARLGSGQPSSGESYLLDGLAAVFIGMTMLRPGTATVVGTFCGALLMGILNNGLNLIGMDSYIQAIVKGGIIILAVSIVSRTTKLRLL